MKPWRSMPLHEINRLIPRLWKLISRGMQQADTGTLTCVFAVVLAVCLRYRHPRLRLRSRLCSQSSITALLLAPSQSVVNTSTLTCVFAIVFAASRRYRLYYLRLRSSLPSQSSIPAPLPASSQSSGQSVVETGFLTCVNAVSQRRSNRPSDVDA